jgi:uncharacterized BrkB/YihY/UPF0761 family membrane protein
MAYTILYMKHMFHGLRLFIMYFQERRIARMAGSLSYAFLLTLIPLAVLFSFMGLIFFSQTETLPFLDSLLASLEIDATSYTLAHIPRLGDILITGIISLIGLISFAYTLQLSLYDIWQQNRKKESLARTSYRTFLGVIILVASALVFILALILPSLIGSLENLLGFTLLSNYSWILISLSSIGSIFLALCIIFYFFGRELFSRRAILFVSGITTLGILGGQVLLRWYFYDAPWSTSAYVSPTLIIILGWIYYTVMIILSGASILDIYYRKPARMAK